MDTVTLVGNKDIKSTLEEIVNQLKVANELKVLEIETGAYGLNTNLTKRLNKIKEKI